MGNLYFWSRVWVLNTQLIDGVMPLHSYIHVDNFNFNFYRLIGKAPILDIDLIPKLRFGLVLKEYDEITFT